MGIPVVDLRDLRGEGRAAFVQALGQAFRDLGFVRVRGHAVDPDRVERAFAAARAFFALPAATKERYVIPGGAGQRGYTPFGAEHAKDNPLPDLKEFWHTGREVGADPELARLYDENLWPAEVPAFRDAMLDLYQALDACSVALLEALALYLGEPADTFTALTRNGNTILRALHYPPVRPELAREGAVRAAAHEDINFITLLVTSTAPGLEIRTRDGAWMRVDAEPGEIIADSGDMMQRVTNGFVPATTHRVVNPDDDASARLSIPFFVHPRPDAVLRALDQFRGAAFPPPAPDITGQGFLDERLRELGLQAARGEVQAPGHRG